MKKRVEYLLKFNNTGVILYGKIVEDYVLNISMSAFSNDFDMFSQDLANKIKERVTFGVEFTDFTSNDWASGMVHDFILTMASNDLYIDEDGVIYLDGTNSLKSEPVKSNNQTVDKLLNDGYTIKKVAGEIVVVE